MKLVKFTANGREIELFCDSRNTRNGFAHDARLFVDNMPWGEGHCYYLNRTWESWTYQSVCIEACGNVMASRKDWLKDNYKYENKISRITKKHREALDAIQSADPELITMREAIRILEKETF